MTGNEHAGTGKPTEEELRAASRRSSSGSASRTSSSRRSCRCSTSAGAGPGLAPGTEDERDLEQLRLAIEGVRALLPLVEPVLGAEAAQIRDALSQLQMAYAQTRGAAPASPGRPGADAAAGAARAAEGGPGPAQAVRTALGPGPVARPRRLRRLAPIESRGPWAGRVSCPYAAVGTGATRHLKKLRGGTLE